MSRPAGRLGRRSAGPSPARGMPKDSSSRRARSAPRTAPRRRLRRLQRRRRRRRQSAASPGRSLAGAASSRARTRSRTESPPPVRSAAKCGRAAKQLRNDRNMGTPASTRVRNPCSSVLNEFHVTTMGFSTSSMKATMSSAKRSVSRPSAPVSPITMTSMFGSAATRSKTRFLSSIGCVHEELGPVVDGVGDGQVVGDHLAQPGLGLAAPGPARGRRSTRPPRP